MYSVVQTAVLLGIDARMVSVEADISNGLPMFEMVGLLASEVRESIFSNSSPFLKRSSE